jgi:hypothetical protein
MPPCSSRSACLVYALPVVLLVLGCSGGSAVPGGPGGPGGSNVQPTDPGAPVSLAPSPTEQMERDQVAAALASVATLDGPGLLGRYPASFAAGLSYDPLTAANLPQLRASNLGLSATEEQALGKNGFVISDRMHFPGFTFGYETIYADDLPVFVSADSILYAVHRSYDSLLQALEMQSMRPQLLSLLTGMRAALGAGTIAGLGDGAARDIDLYLAVPLGLLSGTAPAPVAGASAADIASLMAAATAASGIGYVSLFGQVRAEDFSQFTPRGHYTNSADLGTYFKAMMWLGLIDMRMIETNDDGSQLFHRPQFDAALGLSSLLTNDNQTHWTALAAAISAFVGEADSMQPPEFPALLAALGVSDLAAVPALDDATIAAAIVAGNFGAQRIADQIMVAGVHDQALPLSRSFLLLGQAYVIDSHVFSNVTYDRVPPSPAGRLRMLPDPLDVGFAVFANNQAATLLAPQLDTFAYAPALGAMRVLVDQHGDDFWNKNLYNTWLSSLRALSPVAGGQSGPFELAATEAWGRRVLNTQLASWAELRHDTVLYVKQSSSTGVLCSFPDALVEPNPDFFAKVGAFATKGQEVLDDLGISGTSFGQNVSTYFTTLATVAATLQGMAESQAAGTPFSDDQLAFINQAVQVEHICGGGAYATGWYPQLFYSSSDATDFHPTIADVHTAPTDEAGNTVGNVLHVGTGYARMMVITANSCDGPRAYVGVASSYFEDVTQNLQRLDDPTWTTMLNGTPPPPDVPWTADLIVH